MGGMCALVLLNSEIQRYFLYTTFSTVSVQYLSL